MSPPPLSPSAIFKGRNVFILGSTGFVGKVLLSMLLDRFPQIGRVYVMVRRGSGTSSQDRFWKSIVTAPPLNPLRERLGADAFAEFVRKKCLVVDGDITEPNLGLSEEEAQRVAQDIDVLINSSGRVTFNPPLESALRTNVQGTKNVIAFAKRMRRPALVHTSTCFVAGNRSGEVWEGETLDGYYPRWRDLSGTRFSVEQEIADSDRIAAEVRAQADDAQVMARLRQKARARLLEERRDPDDAGSLKLAVARERKEWIRSELTQRGIDRARDWGWPNIYTYTKSMGDQLVARETGIVRSIVRPAIVESAVRFPFPGWNEGFTTSAPLVYLALKGQNVLPVANDLILDIVPVDHICAGMLMVAAQAIVEQPALVHQLSSGDLNPGYVPRIVTLTGLYKRKRFQDKESGNKFVNELAARMEFRPVTPDEYEARSLPLVNRVADRASRAIARVRPRWGAGRLSETLDRIKKGTDEVRRVTDEARENIDLFRPFILENAYIFRADNIRALRERMPEADRRLLDWSPETLDWYAYWMDVHFPGLAKWVLPELDETYAPKAKQIYGYHDLVELFDTTTKLHATRMALRIERGKRNEIYSYADLRELADRLGAFLVAQHRAPLGPPAGETAGARVILFAKNGPEWSMAYFGILKAGGTAVPVGHESSTGELVNIARASGAAGLLIGDDLVDKHPTLGRELAEAGVATAVWPFHQAFALPDEAIEKELTRQLVSRHNPDTIASLLFTSGTTGKPKGVMLTHRNFTFMVSELMKIFELGPSDGMLSVLPLHHTFEFSTGLLVPLSVGAQVTYLPELTGEAISSALKKGRVTAIVGVPALWDLMKRRVLQRFSDTSPWLETFVKAIAAGNQQLRKKVGIDLGVLVFLPVHEGMGGRIKYLISGGSALSADTLDIFHGMGFDFMEGYGLTETAPVLTVTSPKKAPIAGSVGQALSGVEVRILEPDGAGVGEVVARGRNIMAGYWQDAQATTEAIRDGWFHTGDLGRFDEDGNLFLVGRSKDIIVDSNGKNVYPDEIEELYGKTDAIKELSVVGLPDGTAEHVACAVVPDYDAHKDVEPAELRARIEEHFKEVGSALPFWKRVKVLEFWEGELPRTAKKSVKRREVTAELRKRRRGDDARPADGRDEGAGWFLDIVAQVTGKARSEVHLGSRLEALGMDSIMFTELGVAIENAGVALPEGIDFTGAGDVEGLLKMVSRGRAAQHKRVEDGHAAEAPVDDDLPVPEPVARAGKRLLGLGQRLFYERVMQPTITGSNNVPPHVNFIVVANHCSHLDMGLVKVALGQYGRDLASLAAADYFFRNRARRAYFKNFTNLVPMERSGSIRKSMDIAERVLRQGRSMVVFPEGTRSVTGKMAPFLPSIGYLALRSGVGILPAHLAGTHEALPKGASLPKARTLGVAFGPFLSIDDLQALVAGLSQQEGWRLVAALCQRVVENLRDGRPNALSIADARAAWTGSELPPGGEQRRAPAPRLLPAVARTSRREAGE